MAADRVPAVYGYSMKALDVDGAWVLTPRIHADGRGSFLEWFRDSEFQQDLGYRMDVAQANCSVSRRGVIRGIHFSDVPPGQAKYVTCASGAIIDVVVDLRVGSPGFGRWEAVRLDDETRRVVYISEGLGHAFVAVSDQATVLYLCSTPYAPGREHGVHPLDPAIGIAWPADLQQVLSDKDASAPSLSEAQSAGLLPDYGSCQGYMAGLRSSSCRAGGQPGVWTPGGAPAGRST
jgi:dTDP-4-dehydrorhamnose 3,5-epimerase